MHILQGTLEHLRSLLLFLDGKVCYFLSLAPEKTVPKAVVLVEGRSYRHNAGQAHCSPNSIIRILLIL